MFRLVGKQDILSQKSFLIRNSIRLFYLANLCVIGLEQIGVWSVKSPSHFMPTQVQSERVVNQPEEVQEEYADNFTTNSLLLLENILEDPVPWLGIKGMEKKELVTQIQLSLEEISEDLIIYSKTDKAHLEYNRKLKRQL